MSANIANLKDYNYEAQQDDGVNVVPRSMNPARIARPVQCSKQIKNISAISGSTATSGQLSLIQLPFGAGAGFMKPGSAYLRFRYQGTQAANYHGFKGSVPSAQALIQRLTVSQNSNIELVNEYGRLMTNVIYPFMTSSDYMNNISIQEGGIGNNVLVSYPYATGTVGTGGYGQTDSEQRFTFGQATPGIASAIELSVSLASGLLNNKELSMIPLELMSSPLTIQVDWCSVNNAIYGSTTATTEFTCSNVQLCYESVNPPQQYINELRAGLASGKVFSIPYTTVISAQTSNASTVSYNMSLTSSSVEGFFYGALQSFNLNNSTLTSGWFSCATGASDNSDRTTMNRRLYADGALVAQQPSINSDTLLFRELMRAVQGGFCGTDVLNTIPFSNRGMNTQQPGSFRSTFYAGGFNLKNFNESNLTMEGIPVSILNFQKDDYSGADGILYMYAFVSQIALIDASGSISIVR
ncbi:MAG: hypothetical protein EBU66_20225 [Bacteroidetes bacterium]|nr:hypothetical protein [Bacteroidota bacterium]